MSDDAAHSRRSHAERRAETIELILNATLDAIVELGLRNATTGEICRRAGVSPGAVFHHFETRQDVIVAAVEHHLSDRRVRFTEMVESLRSRDAEMVDPRELLRILRSITREPRAMVWLEVLMETRTDSELRKRITPTLIRQRDLFRAAGELHSGLSSMPESARFAWLELLRNVMHGESIWEQLEPHPELAEAKIDALLALAVHLGATPPPVPV